MLSRTPDCNSVKVGAEECRNIEESGQRRQTSGIEGTCTFTTLKDCHTAGHALTGRASLAKGVDKALPVT